MSESEFANSISVKEIQDDIGNYYDWYNKVVMFPGVFFRGSGDFMQMTAAEMTSNVYNAYDRSFIKDMQTAVDKSKPQARARTDQRPRNIPGGDFVSDDMTPEQIEMLFSGKAF